MTERLDVRAMGDLKTPWCLRVAVDLGIAALLESGPRPVAELAAAADCDRDALHGVLRHLASRGVFDEIDYGVFATNEAGGQLLDPGVRAALSIDPFPYRMAAAWATLPSYVRTGRPAYHELFGRPFWEDVSADPELGASFDAAMAAHHHDARRGDLPLAGGWDDVELVVDVGGGSGALLAAILRDHRHVRGVLVDLAGPVGRSAQVFADAGVTDRVTAVAQSFFDPLPPGGDVYLLSGVLHDFGDEEAIAILRRCAEAARPNGRVVVPLRHADGDPPVDISTSSILVGGRDRSLTQFRTIAEAAGLTVVTTEPLTECRPA